MPLPVNEQTRYQIRAFRLPIVVDGITLGTASHYGLVIYDTATQKVVHEINGLATGTDGVPKPVGFLPSDRLYVWEDAKIGNTSFNYWDTSFDQTVLYTGNFHDVMAKWGGGRVAANAINGQGLLYPLGGFVPDSPLLPSVINSNSVFSTIVQAMGLQFNKPWYILAPGYGNTILQQSDFAAAFSWTANAQGSVLNDTSSNITILPDGSVQGSIAYHSSTGLLTRTETYTYHSGESLKTTIDVSGTIINSDISRTSGLGTWTATKSRTSDDIIVTLRNSFGFTLQDSVFNPFASTTNVFGLVGAGTQFDRNNPYLSFLSAPIFYDSVLNEFYFKLDNGQRMIVPDSPVKPNNVSQPSIDFAGIAQTFGSTLGRLIGGSNLVIGTLTGSVISTVALSVGATLFPSIYHPAANAVGGSGSGSASVWNDFGPNLKQFGVNAAVGSATSYLAAEFAQSLGLRGFGGQVFSFVAGHELNYVATTLLNAAGVTNFLGVSLQASAAISNAEIGGFIGTQLASLIVQPQTVAEATLASLGSAVGTALAVPIGAATSSIALELGIKLGAAAAGFVGAVIGAFVGYILGDLIGSLFGGHRPRVPTASAEVILQIPLAQYALGAETSANGGNLQLADAMAQTARDTLNGLISQITHGVSASFVSNTSSPTQTYGVNGNAIYVKLAGVETDVTSADQAVDKGVLWALPQTKIIGGDVFLKRVVANGTWQTVTEMLGDLQIGADYEFYLKSKPIIDASIGSSWNSLAAGDKTFYSSNKSFMTRAISASQLALTGADITFYNTNKAQVDRIVSGISVSSFAAGWIVTLARAGELGLGNFGPSDFFGGLQGFTQSFGAAATGAGAHYEDITVGLSAGNLTITASGSVAAGTFSLLPQASVDGSSVTIAGFGANAGYGVQSVGTVTAGNDFESAASLTTAVTIGPGNAAVSYVGPVGPIIIPGTNTGDDIFIGGNAGDTLSAGIGNVWIDGSAGNDTINGGAGRDVLLGGAGDDRITSGTGNTYLSGGDGNDVLIGGVGSNVFVGGLGMNSETGGTGNEVFIYGLGETDTINGGGGSNTLSFERRTAGLSFGLTGVSQALDGGSLVNVQNLTGSNYNDSLTTGPGGGTLKGLGGNDNLQGGAGNDILEGGAGADSIAGNDGINTASYDGSSTGVYVNLATGTTIGGDATGDVLTNIQNLTGSANGDELAGNAGVNLIDTGIGDDWIDATAGADTYKGGDGFDTLDYSLSNFVSGSGPITIYLPPYGTPYTYVGTLPAVSVNLSAGTVAARNADGSSTTQTTSGIEQFIGTSGADSFSSYGTTVGVTWDGNGGADTFSGGAGSDTYVFGSGYGISTISDTNTASNTIRMKAGVTFDSLWAANSAGNLQIGIRGEAGYVQANTDFGTAGNDVIKTLDLAGSGQVDLTAINAVAVGSDGADVINGSNATANLIFAYNGNDTINSSSGLVTTQGSVIDGGLGNDTINSSSGDDQFLFERGNGQDVINDIGGINSIVFGPTVDANDVIYQVIGNDLYVGIKDLSNAALTASQVSDYMKIVGGGVRYGTGRFPIPISVIAGGATTDLRKANIAWTAQRDPNAGGGGGGNRPIILDLTGDGLELAEVGHSDIITKDANGNILRSGWVGPTNGILAVDRNGDGRINNTADISFVHDKVGATTDLGGLAGWDTNGDGAIDAKDGDWGKLVVWVDANQNGRDDVGEVKTLDQLGITAISLVGKATGFNGSDSIDSVIYNTTTFTRTDGAIGAAYDVSLATQLLAGPYASSDGFTFDVSAPSTFGKLTNDPLAVAAERGLIGTALTEGALSTLATIDVTSTTGSISRADASRWADLIDPARMQARRDFLANRMSGSEYLDAIRSTSSGNPNILTGRGARDQKTRLQAVVVDFNRNGADLIDAKKSHTLVDVMHTGEVAQIGWVKGSDGILAYDRNGDGNVDPGTEVSFLNDVPNARTAIQGLGAFDTNKDGGIDARDTSFGKFLIWRDQNANGVSDVGEVQSLAQAGVKNVQLSGAKVSPDRGTGSTNDVLGVSKITFTDGSTRAIYNVALGYADSKEEVKIGSGGSIGGSPGAQVQAGSSAATPTSMSTANGQATAKLGANTVSTVGLSRGALDGPGGIVIEAGDTAGDDHEWWRNANVVGQGLAAIASGFANDDLSLGANRSSVAGGGVTDAATLQRLMLLRQNMASLQPASGGSAAIWGHDAANDHALLAASALPAVSAAQARSGAGG